MSDYDDIYNILSNRYEEINGYDFYRYIFPNNENAGEFHTDFSKPNAIYLYRDSSDEGTQRSLRRRIMLNDTWKSDYMEFVEQNGMALCSGLTYRRRANRLVNAQCMNAMAIDLDGVGENELLNLLLRIGKAPSIRTLPLPTFIVMSGTGLHLYYVFDEPIALFPNIKIQLKSLKHDLTFRAWEYQGTSKVEEIQYQSINQGFRMVGSINDKYGTEVRAFQTGERVSIEYLNDYTINDSSKVDLTRPFRPSKVDLNTAKEQYPDWYQRVIVDGNRHLKKWNIAEKVNGNNPYALYDWWIRQADNIKGGHRYFFLMCMAIYACKCDVPKEKLKQDMLDIFGKLSEIKHTNELKMIDIEHALEVYDREYYNFTIADISKLTKIEIKRNNRNYKKQEWHLEDIRAIKANMKKRGQAFKQPEGRPKGSGTAEQTVRAWQRSHQEGTRADCIRDTGLSKPTVYKWWSKDGVPPEPVIYVKDIKTAKGILNEPVSVPKEKLENLKNNPPRIIKK